MRVRTVVAVMRAVSCRISTRKSKSSVSFSVSVMRRIPIARGLGEPWFMFERARCGSGPPDAVASDARYCSSASGASSLDKMTAVIALAYPIAMARVRSDMPVPRGVVIEYPFEFGPCPRLSEETLTGLLPF